MLVRVKIFAEREREEGKREIRLQIISLFPWHTCWTRVPIQTRIHRCTKHHAYACIFLTMRYKNITYVRFMTVSFRGRTCAKSVISKISRQHYLPPIITTTCRRTTRATNNQHFPIPVNLARSFNGKRRLPVRRLEERNRYVDRRSIRVTRVNVTMNDL